MRAKSVVSTFRTALCVPLPGHDGRPVGMVQLDQAHGQERIQGGRPRPAGRPGRAGGRGRREPLATERTGVVGGGPRDPVVALAPQIGPRSPVTRSGNATLPTLEVGGDLYDYIKVEPEDADRSSPCAVGRHGRRRRRQGDAGRARGRRHLPGGAAPGPQRRRARRRPGSGQPPSLRPRSRRPVCDHGDDRDRPAVAPDDRWSTPGTWTPWCAGARARSRPWAARVPERRWASSAPLSTGRSPSPSSRATWSSSTPTASPSRWTETASRLASKRLKKVLAAAPQGAAAAGEAILAAVREHAVGRSQSDDITIVCFERSPT